MAGPRYSSVAIILHWAIAILIVGQIAGGLYMHKLPNISPIKFDLYQLHKSFGLSILALTFARIGWRLTHRPPALPAMTPGWQKLAARGAHLGFYALLLITPLAGWAMVSASPLDIPTKWFGMIGVPHMPFFDGVSDRAAVEDVLKEVHEYLAFGMLYLLALHVGAALKHQFINRDDVLSSIMPRAGQIISVLVILGALAAAGAIYLFGSTPPANAAAAETSGEQSAETLSGNWSVDYGASRLGFVGAEKGRQFEGTFGEFTASINFDPEDLTASQIDVAVSTNSAGTGDELRDSSLPGAEWFGVKEHPTARFTSTAIRSVGGSNYEAAGNLTIKDVEQAIILPFTLEITGDSAIATGGVDLIRTEFDLGAASAWLDEEEVALEVRVEFMISATRTD